MITFEYLNKTDFSVKSRELFNILADNMIIIAPTDNSREEDYKCWYEAMSDALLREERNIIVFNNGDEIIGYFQYNINANTLVMEEIQIKSDYQGRGLVRELYKFVDSIIKTDIEFVEAYANINNIRSIGMLEKFGLSKIGLNKNGHSYHFKGKNKNLKTWYEKH